jgi:prepilin-type N-terminal cleavage/methylation domain-containing protein
VNTLAKQNGFSLIELMISLAISIFLLGAIFSFFTGNLSMQKNTLQELNLNREIRFGTDIVNSELKRAGYYPDTIIASADINKLQPIISKDKKCILFQYYNTASPATVEISGFRWISGTRQGKSISVLQMRNNSAGKCNPDTDTITSDNWEDLTNPSSINVTAFSIQNSSSDPSKIDIKYQAETISNAGKALTKTDNFSVYLPNINKLTNLPALD